MWWSSGSGRKWWSQRTSFASKRRCWEHCHRCGGRLLGVFSAKETDSKKSVHHRCTGEENATDCNVNTEAHELLHIWLWAATHWLEVKYWEKFQHFVSNTMKILWIIQRLCLKASCRQWTLNTLVSQNSGDTPPLHGGRDCGVQRAAWPTK